MERLEAGLGAKVDYSPAVFRLRKISWIGVVKDSSAKSYEVRRANRREF